MEYLLRHAADEGAKPRRHHGYGMLAAAQLIVHVPVPHYRPRDELREKSHICSEGGDISLYFGVPPVHVHCVGHSLKCVKGYADGQRYVKSGQPAHKGYVTENVGEKIVVFEKSQHRKVDDNARQHESLRLFRRRLPICSRTPAAYVVYGDGEQHDEHVYRLAPAVKGKTRHKQYDVAPPQRSYKVYEHRYRKKTKQKLKRGEYHAPHLLTVLTH
jgi:hypothetical protein